MINRLIIRLLLLIFVALLLAPWALKRENGTRIMSFDEFLSFDISLITNRYREAVARIRSVMADDMDIEGVRDKKAAVSDTRTLYKWKDEKGDLHFTDQKPDDYISEEVVVEINKNVFDFEDINKKDSESTKKTDNKDKNEE